MSDSKHTVRIPSQLLLTGWSALALTILSAALGYYACARFSAQLLHVLRISGIICAAVLVALLPLNFISSRAFGKHISDMSVQQSLDMRRKQREDVQTRLAHAQQRITRLRRLYDAYTLLIILLSIYVSFTSYSIGGMVGSVLLAVPCVFALLGVLCRIRLYRTKKSDFADYVAPSAYPHLYAVAQHAADAHHLSGTIHIRFIPACTAGIARVGSDFSLLLGAPLLCILSEEELEQVLLHEFAHMDDEGDARSPEFRLYTRLCQLSDDLFSFARPFFLAPDVVYAFHYNLYQEAASTLFEETADQVILSLGNPQQMVNALAKLNFHSLFEDEIDWHLPDLFYAEETPPKDNISRLLNTFHRVLPQREAAWRAMADHEIQAQSASHPIFRSRMQALGVEEYTISWPQEDTPLYHECLRALELVDQQVYALNLEDYAQERERNYLSQLRTLEAWEASGHSLDEESIRPVIHALRSLGRRSEAEALCERVISETANPYATAYARFIKGCLLLEHGDIQGLACVYEAIDLNSNFLESGLDQIGSACCKYGWQEELENYRRRAVELVQKYQDERIGDDELLPGDSLSAEPLEGDMLEQILAYIRSIDQGSIQRIFLVRKHLKGDHFVSAFVVEFKKDTPEQLSNDVMSDIFEHLDVHPSGWHFALFSYHSDTAKAVAKVESSCVYTAE